MSSSSKKLLLPSLIKANNAILQQKLTLLDILNTKHGFEQTTRLFTKTCPILQASIGQHYRHSMDHIELAALTASSTLHNENTNDLTAPIILRYDLRVRGGTLEKDVTETRKRICSVIDIFSDLEKNHNSSRNSNDDEEEDIIASTIVNASFMLTSDGDEMELKSTIGRELGFCAHHAIHHMAMVKIIATQTLGIDVNELPMDFGKAPSTVNFEKQN